MTKSELRDRAAHDLGKIRLDGSLQHQDKVRIEQGYDEVYDELEEEGLATWPIDGPIPNKVVKYVSGLVALNCALTYSLSQERLAAIYEVVGVDGEEGKRMIQSHVIPEQDSTSDLMYV